MFRNNGIDVITYNSRYTFYYPNGSFCSKLKYVLHNNMIFISFQKINAFTTNYSKEVLYGLYSQYPEFASLTDKNYFANLLQ